MSDTTTPPEEPTLASILDHIRALDERLDDMHADQVDANAAADDVPVEYDGMPMSETLRDVVNSQLLALARAETEEAVHASVNAIHEVLHRDDPPEPDVFDRLETLLSRPEVQPLVALVIVLSHRREQNRISKGQP